MESPQRTSAFPTASSRAFTSKVRINLPSFQRQSPRRGACAAARPIFVRVRPPVHVGRARPNPSNHGVFHLYFPDDRHFLKYTYSALLRLAPVTGLRGRRHATLAALPVVHIHCSCQASSRASTPEVRIKPPRHERLPPRGGRRPRPSSWEWFRAGFWLPRRWWPSCGWSARMISIASGVRWA